MLCSDTGQTQVVHVEGMNVQDAKRIGKALAAVRDYGNGTGEICIPLINRFFKKLRITIDAFDDGKK